ncbi:hypothetical protein [Clostridium felsineum]|uniref:Uncharacterized protein n=2 Tax=Clostridium felsineum TaxID=36839 RepID=A0A1S8LRF2_9CLOT|nr:hypothetical protein [Clostridium felsineum]URZ06592.1 hypothetical protein CLROS_019250 [Clostridium felsineum]URZ11627.1 hypothetical protein CROST_023440 [Clostridium felsineum]
MNLYEVRDFFNMNTNYDDENIEEQIEALGKTLKNFWSMSFEKQLPDKKIAIKLFEEDKILCITVFEGV